MRRNEGRSYGSRHEDDVMPFRMPPPRRDIQAERAVLGGVLLDNAVLADVEPVLAADDFYDPRHGEIYEAILACASRREPIDIVTLANELRCRDRLNTVGGAQYLGELTDVIPTIAHIESHARIIADEARVRRVVTECLNTIAKSGEGVSGDELCAYAEEKILAAASRRDERDMVHIGDATLETVEHYERVAIGGGEVDGTPTGYTSLDELLGGLQGGQSIVLAARPAMGKSALAINIIRRAAERTKKTAALFSLEMPRMEVTRRFLSDKGGIDQTLLRKVRLPGDDSQKMFNAANAISRLPIWIDDSGDITLADIRAKCRRLKRRGGLSLVVIDYLQLMKASRSSRDESREREVANMSRGIKMLAKELNVPIIVLSQLNRGPDERSDHRPVIADLRESGAIEQDADVVMFIYRDVVYNKKTENPAEAEIIVAKQRNGPTDTIRLNFISHTSTFVEPGAYDEFAAPTPMAPSPGTRECRADVPDDQDSIDNC